MSQTCHLLMLSAMYENGGNTTHRFLDGHPQMFVYPFESQIGTRLVQDSLSSMFPQKYRWPEFALNGTAYGDYKAIIDEEGKVRSRTPKVSKFRHVPFDMNDDERCEIYQRRIGALGRSSAHNVQAFFEATFEAWKDFKRSGQERVYVGYSPIIVVDFERILNEHPTAQILHVVRNPWSAYADTKKRPVPMSLAAYIHAWNINQYYALLGRKKYPGRVHIVRTEDVMADSQRALRPVCDAVGVSHCADSLKSVSWNGTELEAVYPWGTIRKATPAANHATANELSAEEQHEIRLRTWQYLEEFNYTRFLD